MEIGIIGLPKSGKTTIFNTLTGKMAKTTAYSPDTLEPNIGVAKIQDTRLLTLKEIFKPKKVVPAEVKYVDVAIPKSKEPGKGLSSQFLGYLSNVDAIIHVVRVFENEMVPHIEGSVNSVRDIASINLELAFSDLAIIERRLKRIEDSLKGARPQERQEFLHEQALLRKIKSDLEKEIPLREQSLADGESKIIANFQFLTAKPLLLVLNVGEVQLPQATSLETELHVHHPNLQLVTLCGKLEMELAQLDELEAEEFRATLDIQESGVNRILQLSQNLLKLISFFTTASDELKAWTIHADTPAPKAAGKIHSDMERGFIRAEVVGYEDLIKCGSLSGARKRGLLRLEGKSYIVQDGDVITFLFNV